MRRINSSNILLMMDNCGGHECDINLPGVRIETLPVNSTSKNQPLDLGLIAHSRIRNRSLPLLKMVENTLRRSSVPTPFQRIQGRESMVYTMFRCLLLVMLWICSMIVGLKLKHAQYSDVE